MIWLAAAATFGSVFLATLAFLWPRPIPATQVVARNDPPQNLWEALADINRQ